MYILGAGFSIPAGAPSQEGILWGIWNLAPEGAIEEHQSKVRRFLNEVLNVDETKVSLEDVYTPVDRCLADGIGLRGTSVSELQEVRDSLGYLISKAIRNKLQNTDQTRGGYVDDFAKFLVQMAAVRADRAQYASDASEAKAYDPFAVISLNWDILLDNAINDALRVHDNGQCGDYDPFGVVDYCCYISSVEYGDKRIRTGLWSLGCRGYNVKLLKIHGSMNWLQCSNCQRLFVGFNEKLYIPNFERPRCCRHCSKYGHRAELRGSLVMPTFLKDLSNFQVKLVWQNAAIELMEAKRLVFIGYSLPFADFEFRQVLSRMVHKDARIDVVLWEGSPSYEDECDRYRKFFSKHEINIKGIGVVDYVKQLLEQSHTASLMSTVQNN